MKGYFPRPRRGSLAWLATQGTEDWSPAGSRKPGEADQSKCQKLGRMNRAYLMNCSILNFSWCCDVGRMNSISRKRKPRIQPHIRSSSCRSSCHNMLRSFSQSNSIGVHIFSAVFLFIHITQHEDPHMLCNNRFAACISRSLMLVYEDRKASGLVDRQASSSWA
jgi:hypothetical protein